MHVYYCMYYCMLLYVYYCMLLYVYYCQDLEEKMGYLIGDVLIASAFMSYMGPFLSNYREDLVNKNWIIEVRYHAAALTCI